MLLSMLLMQGAAKFAEVQLVEERPSYLYKILTVENWNESQNKNAVLLPKEDAGFIHFSTEDQLERILAKYWSHQREYVILKIQTDQLPGRLAFEANPGGTSKYYHLYEGSIPLQAIVESRLIRSNLHGP